MSPKNRERRWLAFVALVEMRARGYLEGAKPSKMVLEQVPLPLPPGPPRFCLSLICQKIAPSFVSCAVRCI
jgi:hypothetical protein